MSANVNISVGQVAVRKHVGQRKSRATGEVKRVEFDQFFVVDLETGKTLAITAKAKGATLCFLGWLDDDEVDSICRQLAAGVEFQDEHGQRVGTIAKPVPKDSDGSWRVSMPGGPKHRLAKVERDTPILDADGLPHTVIAETVVVDDDEDDDDA